MSTDKGMDKEDVVHIYNGLLLGHKKEWKNAICSSMDGARDYHNNWSHYRERQTSYDSMYMWNLKKGYKWTYLQNSNRLTNFKHKFLITWSSCCGSAVINPTSTHEDMGSIEMNCRTLSWYWSIAWMCGEHPPPHHQHIGIRYRIITVLKAGLIFGLIDERYEEQIMFEIKPRFNSNTVPTVVQWDQRHLCSTRTQVQFPGPAQWVKGSGVATAAA